MRNKQLEVPQEAIAEFAELLEENDIDNTIIGVNDEGEIIIEVNYDRDQRNGVMQLIELAENFGEETEVDEEE